MSAVVLCGDVWYSSAVRGDGVLSSRISARLSRQQASRLPGHNGGGREARHGRLVQETEARLVPVAASWRRRRRWWLPDCSDDERSRLLRVPDCTWHALPGVAEGLFCFYVRYNTTTYHVNNNCFICFRFFKWTRERRHAVDNAMATHHRGSSVCQHWDPEANPGTIRPAIFARSSWGVCSISVAINAVSDKSSEIST